MGSIRKKGEFYRMNARKMITFCLFCLFFVFLLPARGQEGAENEKRFKKLEQENQELRRIIEQLQARLDNLEGIPAEKTDGEKKSKKKESEETKETKKADKEADAAIEEDQEAKEKKKDPSWLPSLSGENFRLGGRVQVEYFNPENERALSSAVPETPGGGFKLDEFRINLDADLSRKIRFHSTYDFENDSEDSGLVEAYVDFEELPFYSELRIGLQSRFYRPSRYTEAYPLAGIAFWRKRDLGVTWKGNFDPVYAYLSVTNGNKLDRRRLGEDDSGWMLSDSERDIDEIEEKELSAGLGIEMDFERFGKVDLMGFGMTGELTDDDIDFLQQEIPGYGQSNRDTRELAGVNLGYKIGEWDFFSQAIGGQHGEVERFAWYAEMSRKWTLKGLRYLKSMRPLIRYGQLDTNLTPRAFSRNGSLTWDREQWLFAIISEITNNVTFRTEYMLNDEKTGFDDAQNNEILFQLEVAF